MQAYKEIQVPVEKAKEVYEKFYKELKELEQPAKEKEDQLKREWREFHDKEKELRQDYYSLDPRAYWYDNSFGLDHVPECSPIQKYIDCCTLMIGAINLSTGVLTMTQSQVQAMQMIADGKEIEKVKNYINFSYPPYTSYYLPRIEFLRKKKEQETPQKQEQPTVDPGDQGSFGGAMFGIVCLFALVCVMIKSCS